LTELWIHYEQSRKQEHHQEENHTSNVRHPLQKKRKEK
jgi:hypothetical protein